jgi:hypothetical protein
MVPRTSRNGNTVKHAKRMYARTKRSALVAPWWLAASCDRLVQAYCIPTVANHGGTPHSHSDTVTLPYRSTHFTIRADSEALRHPCIQLLLAYDGVFTSRKSYVSPIRWLSVSDSHFIESSCPSPPARIETVRCER